MSDQSNRTNIVIAIIGAIAVIAAAVIPVVGNYLLTDSLPTNKTNQSQDSDSQKEDSFPLPRKSNNAYPPKASEKPTHHNFEPTVRIKEIDCSTDNPPIECLWIKQ